MLSVHVSNFTQLSVPLLIQMTMKATMQFLEKLLCSPSQQPYISEFEFPFWVISVLK